MTIKTYVRDSKSADLKPYCHFAKEDSFIEVTDWYNGEGYDIIISSGKEKRFTLTLGEFEALVTLINYKE